MDGILNVYKEPGYTSFDVVARLRGILKQKKIGHTGTLDPAAAGVLPVCLGKATKLCSMITDGTKTYEAVLLLGVKTDTLDMEGQVLQTCPVKCSPEEVRTCIKSFTGEQEQLPPMYSAIKKNGKRLYELARKGITVEREPRKVFFYELNIKQIDLPRVSFEIRCSKGTYIRTLCSDIGDALGCGGCMEKLIRTKSGGFCAENAYKLAEIQHLADEGTVEDIILPMEEVFSGYPAVKTNEAYDKTIHNGGKLSADGCIQFQTSDENASVFADMKKNRPESAENTDFSDVRMYDSSNKFIGIYTYSPDGDMLYPKKMLI